MAFRAHKRHSTVKIRSRKAAVRVDLKGQGSTGKTSPLAHETYEIICIDINVGTLRRSSSLRRPCTLPRDRCTCLRLHRWWWCPAGMESATTTGVAIGAGTSGRPASTTTETIIFTAKKIATTARRATPRGASADQSAGQSNCLWRRIRPRRYLRGRWPAASVAQRRRHSVAGQAGNAERCPCPGLRRCGAAQGSEPSGRPLAPRCRRSVRWICPHSSARPHSP